MKTNSAVGKNRSRLWVSVEAVALVFIVAAYVCWISILPCFPTTDGPVHMYYVHVLSALLSGGESQYVHFFRIRHLLPPYSLYYYALMVLSKFVPMLVADRIIICTYFVSFVYGFRYLARAIGPSAELMTLLCPLLLLNWPLGMGFVNFCLSLSFSFWATGLWLRIVGTSKIGPRILFLVMVTAIMLTHPVPLLLLLAVGVAILGVRFLHASRAKGRFAAPAHASADILTLAIAFINLGYVKLFSNKNPFRQTPDMVPSSYWAEMVRRLGSYSREHGISILQGQRWDTDVYRLGLLLILVFPMALAFQQRLRNSRAKVWTKGDTFFSLGVVLLVGLPWIPSQLNGLYYFADRLVICVWLAFLLAASGWSSRSGEDVNSPSPEAGEPHRPTAPPLRLPVPEGAATMIVVGFAIVVNCVFLGGAYKVIRPLAETVSEVDHAPSMPHDALGFALEDSRLPLGSAHVGVTWNPNYWAAIHLFRRNDDILMNAPWMDESIIPVTDTAALPQVQLPVLQPPFPNRLQNSLLLVPDELSATLRMAQFFVVNQADRPIVSTDPLLQAEPDAKLHWSCSPIARDAYRVCEKSLGGGEAALPPH